MKKIILYSVLILLSGCGQVENNGENQGKDIGNETEMHYSDINIANTKWRFILQEGCDEIYSFNSDSTYEYNSCEWDNIFKGNFSVKKDTIVLIQNEYRDYYANDGTVTMQEEKVRYKLLLRKNYFVILSREEFVQGRWDEGGSRDIIVENNKYYKLNRF
ncbi:hypothetical protein [Pseudopedobacter beijingensis]|uniref:Lipocalin-like domain-containing protein n=1 Tax=Pseudopedobacter beijingensis TaxID=1207056 RepID=A0ABW4I939_9SPHI